MKDKLLTVPARAYATTRGGEARQLALVNGWTRPSKLRFPESTAAATMSGLTQKKLNKYDKLHKHATNRC